MITSLDSIIRGIADDVTTKFVKKEIGYPRVSATGSSAALFNKKLLGNGVYRPIEKIMENGDMDIAVFHPRIPNEISNVGYEVSNLKNAYIWINNLSTILCIPAAAYALSSSVSYTLKEGDGITEKISEIINRSINKDFPHRVLKKIVPKMYENKEYIKNIIEIILKNLYKAVLYTEDNLTKKLIYKNAEIHDLFKFVGAIVAYILFAQENILYTREKALQEICEGYESKYREICNAYNLIKSRWEEYLKNSDNNVLRISSKDLKGIVENIENILQNHSPL